MGTVHGFYSRTEHEEVPKTKGNPSNLSYPFYLRRQNLVKKL